MASRPGSSVRRAFPDRIFDVGIAEQHAVTSAAGLALGGMHPVVARLRDVPQPRVRPGAAGRRAAPAAGVTFVLDRAGITGPDGPSHNGMWDMSILQRRARAPDRRTARRRAAARGAARGGRDRRTARRSCGSPRGRAAGHPGGRAGRRCRRAASRRDADVLLVAVGAMARLAVDVAERLAGAGLRRDRRGPALGRAGPGRAARAGPRHGLVVTVEDNGRVGGVGSVLSQALRDAGIDCRRVTSASRNRFLAHGTRAQVQAEVGLTAQEVARRLVEQVAGREPALDTGVAQRGAPLLDGWRSTDEPLPGRDRAAGSGCHRSRWHGPKEPPWRTT